MPGSAKSEVVGTLEDGTLKVKIAAPADKGKANAQLCSVLAKHYGVPVRAVTIVSGAASRNKLVKIQRA